MSSKDGEDNKNKRSYYDKFKNIEDANQQPVFKKWKNRQFVLGNNQRNDIEKEKNAEIFEKALNYAIDIRKFEIELYWKRATYFWTFIAAAFTAYSFVYSRVDSGKEKEIFLLLFSCLGLLFSFSLFLVNKGSKYWQDNWERHVDLLEDKVIGPLYKIIVEPPEIDKNGWLNWITNPAPYSVSKINQLLSLIISVFWLLLVLHSAGIMYFFDCFKLDWFFNWFESSCFKFNGSKLLLIIIACISIYLLSFKTKSNHTKKTTNMTKIR